MFDDVKLNLTPAKKELNEIKEWLRDSQTDDSNFYGNWTVIERAFYSNTLITFDLKNEPIGYLVWNSFSNNIVIDIFQVNKECGRRKDGSIFFKLFCNYIVSLGYREIRIAAIGGSQEFWLKMGFKEFRTDSNSNQDYTHYMMME